MPCYWMEKIVVDRKLTRYHHGNCIVVLTIWGHIMETWVHSVSTGLLWNPVIQVFWQFGYIQSYFGQLEIVSHGKMYEIPTIWSIVTYIAGSQPFWSCYLFLNWPVLQQVSSRMKKTNQTTAIDEKCAIDTKLAYWIPLVVIAYKFMTQNNFLHQAE